MNAKNHLISPRGLRVGRNSSEHNAGLSVSALIDESETGELDSVDSGDFKPVVAPA